MNIEATLAEILGEVKATNGRVTRLEEEVFGAPEHANAGLIEELREVKKVVLDDAAVRRHRDKRQPTLVAIAIALTGTLTSLLTTLI